MRNKKGLTLVEVVVAMGLFGVIMVTLFPAFLINNLMNITSREFTDANFEAQSELEEIYNGSKDPVITGTTPLEATADVIANMNYGSCTVSGAITSCIKNEIDSDYIFTIDYNLYKDPVTNLDTNLTNVVITATSKISREANGTAIGNDRAQLQIILRFGENFTP